jgi:threonylcarbamoyladenosine tRNA methylthiotransferase MtaB
VTGCYATRRPEELAALSRIVQVVPNARKDSLAEEIGLTSAERFGQGDGACGAEIAPGLAGRTALTLCVQTGCNEICSYCIIPSTRGSGRKVAITGVHLGSYGRDLMDGSSLVGLLRAIEAGGWAVRFRLSSLEPMDCSDEIVSLVRASTSVAPHFHLPLQHASDRMLARMRRPYTLAYYRRLVDRIRTEIPHASIGSDVIVGFPGETGADFEALASYLSESPLTHLHVFPYSDRPGTAAVSMPDRIDGASARARAERIRNVGRELTERFHASQQGAVRPALTIDDGSLVVTDNYLKVRIPPGHARNEWVSVRIERRGAALEGTVIEPPNCGLSNPGLE